MRSFTIFFLSSSVISLGDPLVYSYGLIDEGGSFIMKDLGGPTWIISLIG